MSRILKYSVVQYEIVMKIIIIINIDYKDKDE